MTEPNAAPTASAPNGSAPSVAAAIAPGLAAPAVPPAVPEAKQPIGITSDQLAQRLAEERAKGAAALLGDLGFAKSEDAKAFFKTAKDMQQAQMSEQEKLAARLKELEPAAQRVPMLEGRLKSLVDAQFASLPESARTAIDKQANGDPEKRLQLIELMRDSGLLPMAGVAAAAAAATTPTATPPLTTAPPATQPKPQGAQTAFDKWQSLTGAGRAMAADTFFALNQREIERTRPQGQ